MTIVGDHGRPFFRHVFDDFEVFDFLYGPRGARMALGERFGRVLGGLEGIRGSSGRCWSGLGGHLAARQIQESVLNMGAREIGRETERGVAFGFCEEQCG